jgi:hypothetical protein
LRHPVRRRIGLADRSLIVLFGARPVLRTGSGDAGRYPKQI